MNLTRALKLAKKFNEQGIACSLSHLPVIHNSSRSVNQEVLHYFRILKGIARHKLNCDVTVKLPQLGIYQGEKIAHEAVERIAAEAKRHHNFLWIDMALPDTVDATIRIFREVRKRHSNTGICLQAYLGRTGDDLRSLLKERVPVRLVKGFYKKHDIESWDEVTENYEDLLKLILINSERPAVATHDPEIIEQAKRQVDDLNIRNAEFQFFEGVRDDLALKLVREGYHVRIYIPYGYVWGFLLSGLNTIDIWRHIQRMLGLKLRP